MTTQKTQKPKLVPLSHRRAIIPESELRKQRLTLNLYYAVFIVLGVVCSLFIGRRIVPTRYMEGPLYATTARVEQKTMAGNGNRSNAGYSSGQLVFRIHGQLVSVETLDLLKWTQTQEGATVSVTYRQDKSGAIYIDDWQTAPQQQIR